MEKEIRKFVAAISTLGLLAACSGTNAIEAKKGDTSLSAQNIGSFVGHDGLVRQYQNRATKLLEIAAEHEKRLQYCEDNSYLYGRYGQDSRAHAIALVQKYTLAAEKATASAFHHTWYRSLRNAIILLRWRHLDLDCPKSLAVNVAGTV